MSWAEARTGTSAGSPGSWSSMAWDGSAQMTVAPAAASWREYRPVPQPMSATTWPGPMAARSRMHLVIQAMYAGL